MNNKKYFLLHISNDSNQAFSNSSTGTVRK
nr:MAG TPA: hypothetical protein [Caudoviricetes sp.]